MNQSIPKKRIGAAEVATEIRSLILAESLVAAERLPSERILSEEYSVSRGTVREALLRLEKENLVEIRAGSGTYVTYDHTVNDRNVISNALPLEMMDTRFALEPHICRLAVLHGRENDFEKLAKLIEIMEQNSNNPREFSKADSAFHATLVESTGNSLLIWIISQINEVRAQDQWSLMRKVTLNEQIIKTYNIQHRAILKAVRERDPERAASLMKEHLETARQSLTRAAET